MNKILVLLTFLTLIGLACRQGGPLPPAPQPDTPTPTLSRLDSIPANIAKITPDMDLYSPKSLTAEYLNPVPLPSPVNTAGAEDSAFIMSDGNTLYVWFTPDPNRPPEKQVADGVTGIYVFHKVNDVWGNAERVILQDAGKLSLDGCEFVLGNQMWFCAVREGYNGMHWFTAELKDGKWQNWQNADFKPEYEVGESHITADGKELYFHSSRPGDLGGYDIWVSTNVNGEWQEPINLTIVNSTYSDGWPFVSQDSTELWFTRLVGAPELWRSKKVNGQWSEPQRMFAPFAGEASMDNEGNIYFTHHFYKNNVMLEADIYVAHKATK